MSPALRFLLIILLIVLVVVGVVAARSGPACENPATLGAIESGDVPAHSHEVCLDGAGRGVSNVADAGLGDHAHLIEDVLDAGTVPGATAPHTHSISSAIRRGPE